MRSRVIVSVRVAVGPARAFDAFVGEIGRWWRPSPLFAFTDRAGGVLAFEGRPPARLVERYPDGEAFEVGAVLLYAPPERLRFAWRQSTYAPEEAGEVEVRFEALGASGAETRVTVEHGGFDRLAAGHRARHGFPEPVLLRRAAELWRAGLAGLAAPEPSPDGHGRQGGPRPADGAGRAG